MSMEWWLVREAASEYQSVYTNKYLYLWIVWWTANHATGYGIKHKTVTEVYWSTPSSGLQVVLSNINGAHFGGRLFISCYPSDYCEELK